MITCKCFNMKLTKNVTCSADSMTTRVHIWLLEKTELILKLGNESLWDEEILGDAFSSDMMVVLTDIF